jgi:hypothetical protein
MIFLNLLNVIKIIKIFTWNVFKLHELSDMIISDYESQFIMIFWKTLCTWLEINSWLLITCHLKTDESDWEHECDHETVSVNVLFISARWLREMTFSC